MGVAKVSSKKYPSDMMVKYEPESTIHVNVQKHGDMDSIADIGKKISFSGTGIVRSLHKDEMSHTMRIDIQKIKPL